MKTHIIPSRYLTPKWQAYIPPHDRSFKFDNGVEISSLWELKLALTNIPEDYLANHLKNGSNNIADWVEHTIEDVRLANELRKYNHRWGLVASLERHMMRTLSLPHYVALRWLRPASSAFSFVSGESVNSLTELAQTLEHINDEVISFHQERVPNDISAWVADCIGDYELAELLEEAVSREQMQRFVSDHIQMLQEASLEC